MLDTLSLADIKTDISWRSAISRKIFFRTRVIPPPPSPYLRVVRERKGNEREREGGEGGEGNLSVIAREEWNFSGASSAYRGGAANRDALNLLQLFQSQVSAAPVVVTLRGNSWRNISESNIKRASFLSACTWQAGFLLSQKQNRKCLRLPRLTISLNADRSLPKCNAIIIICSFGYSSAWLSSKHIFSNVVISLFDPRLYILVYNIHRLYNDRFWIMDNNKSSC